MEELCGAQHPITMTFFTSCWGGMRTVGRPTEGSIRLSAPGQCVMPGLPGKGCSISGDLVSDRDSHPWIGIKKYTAEQRRQSRGPQQWLHNLCQGSTGHETCRGRALGNATTPESVLETEHKIAKYLHKRKKGPSYQLLFDPSKKYLHHQCSWPPLIPGWCSCGL